MFYYLYQITNKVNGKIYVGVHKAKSMDDGYMGSGKVIKAAIEKYGLENFEKVILEMFEDATSMYAREKEIVDEEFLLREDVYNLATGGSGGSIEQNRKPFTQNHSSETKQKISESSKGKIVSEQTKRKLKENSWSRTSPCEQQLHAVKAGKLRWSNFDSVEHSTESRKKISCSLLQTNELNKQLGISHHNTGKKREMIKCPRCGKEGAKNVMIRWHFDKCKY